MKISTMKYIWLSCVLLYVAPSSCQFVSYKTTVGVADKFPARVVRYYDASENVTVFFEQIDFEKVGVDALKTKVFVASKAVDGPNVYYNMSLHNLVPTASIASNMLWFDDQFIEKDQQQTYDRLAATYSDEIMPQDTLLSEFKMTLMERHFKCILHQAKHTKPSWLPN